MTHNNFLSVKFFFFFLKILVSDKTIHLKAFKIHTRKTKSIDIFFTIYQNYMLGVFTLALKHRDSFGKEK